MRRIIRGAVLATVVWTAVLAVRTAWAQNSVIKSYPPTEFFTQEEWQRSSRAAPEDMAWWQDAKFGLLIQWGPVVLTGKEVSWSRGGSRGPEKGRGDTPAEEYDNLYKRFNPLAFDADEWVRTAQRAGQRYFIFQAKHHDGFCLWDTKTTPYNIMNTPIHRDLLKETASACRRANMPLGIYFSQRDWYHPDYFGPGHARYVEYMHEQVRELLTAYGPIRILWLDAWYPGVFKAADWKAEELFETARRLQPGLIINNRSSLPGDFDTPEDYIGEFQIDRPWEHDFPVSEQWAWKPDDAVKPLPAILQTIVECAVRGGNTLMGLGPRPDGRLDPRQMERAQEVGQWLGKYGESIYGTRGGPFVSADWGGTTWRGAKVYVHLLHWSGDQALGLPPLAQRITASRVLTGGKADVTQTEAGITIRIPRESRDQVDTIVELTLDGPAARSGGKESPRVPDAHEAEIRFR